MKKIVMLSGLIAALAAFWASAHPDGLDKVSETLGFAARAVERQSFMTDYALPFLPAGPISTALAGLIGISILLGIFGGVKLLASKNK
ncbi:MAG: PDGLE domain-containing protein [Candidatus Saganbacteria bacterium]|nr:PDGLE domain-containing protein [Candidatus Saganbacteria bacterium]